MDDSTLRALRYIQERRTIELRHKQISELQSQGLVQRLNGELALTPKGAAILTDRDRAATWPEDGFAAPDDQ